MSEDSEQILPCYNMCARLQASLSPYNKMLFQAPMHETEVEIHC